MTAQTKMSGKGQVVIPKDLRDRLNWAPGTEIEIEESLDGVILRPKRSRRKRLTMEEFVARRPKYEGPPISIEEMDAALLRGVRDQWEREERIRRSR
jgi:AbrB family looped-hinge helix DNA binding protein